MKLFETDIELVPLSISYQKIKDYNQLITKEDILDGSSWAGILNGVDSTNAYIRIPFAPLVAIRSALKEDLEKLINAEWWK